MKIYYNNTMSRKMPATVWVNDQAYMLPNRSSIDLKVRRGDTVAYKVGRLSAQRKIDFQSPDASFAIEPNKKLQTIYISVMLAVLLILWYLKQDDSIWVSIMLVAAIFGFEFSNYFRGYMIRPMH